MTKLRAIFLVLSSFVATTAWAQDPGTSSRTYYYGLLGETFITGPTLMLLEQPQIQKELNITETQMRQGRALTEHMREEIFQARAKIKDFQEFRKARDAVQAKAEAELRGILGPQQHERLKQIELQLQGFVAFTRPEFQQELGLTRPQVEKIGAIVAEAEKGIREKAFVSLGQESPDRPASIPAIRKWIELPETKALIEKGRRQLREYTAGIDRKFEEMLTESQRTSYHKMLGERFDITKGKEWDPIAAARNVAGNSGLLGQRADPDFNVKVANPAYTKEHPKVLFDEAHHNFHTASGRYKPFADLITNDGYRIEPNQAKFTSDGLKKGDVLIIANALGAEGMGQPGADASAFSDSECEAVRNWVESGGALLLITDHRPMGPAAEKLAKQFHVDMGMNTTTDPQNSEERAASCLVFARAKNLVGDHPIMRGRNESERINRVFTFTGQSLKGPEGSTPLLKLADSAIDQSFDGQNTSAAGRAQGIALRVGKGRVVVLGEAAQLSAQIFGEEPGRMGMNVPGSDNRQFALNIMHWLSGLLEDR